MIFVELVVGHSSQVAYYQAGLVHGVVAQSVQ
jgi:hypothetical protein